MAELHLWQRTGTVEYSGAFVLAGNRLERTPARGLVEYCDVALGDSRPCHPAAMRIRTLPHELTPGIVCEQVCDFAADGVGIAERHEQPSTSCQQLLRVPIRSRHHRFPKAKTVGQGAGGHLRYFEIRGNVHIAHRYEVNQRLLIDELVEKYNMVFDAELPHAGLQTLAVGFPLA